MIILGDPRHRYKLQVQIYLWTLFSVFTGHFRQTQTQSCRRQRIWPPPSSTPSSSTLPWQTRSSNTCVCWTSTRSLPCLATLASSAQSVRLTDDPSTHIIAVRDNRVVNHVCVGEFQTFPFVLIQDLLPDLWRWARK